MGAAVIEWVTTTPYETVALWMGSFVALMLVLDVLTYLGAKLARKDGIPHGEARLRLIRLQVRWGDESEDRPEQQAEVAESVPSNQVP